MSNDVRSRLHFPNPFAPTGIEFELSEPGLVTLAILDETGQHVRTIVENKRFDQGKHQVLAELKEFTGRNHVYQMVVEMKGERVIETKNII